MSVTSAGACKLLICTRYVAAAYKDANAGKVAAAALAAGQAGASGELTQQQVDGLADDADDLLQLGSPTKAQFDAYIAAVEAVML